MESGKPFDPSEYMRAPNMSIATGIALARSLVKEMPATMPAHVQRAATRLTAVHEAAQAAWADRQREDAPASTPGERAPTQVLDLEADRSWSALRSRLLAYADLPGEQFPQAARARELCNLLFGADGLEFLADTFVVQFETMDTLLERITDEALAADIDSLAGPEFLAQIRHVHPRYEAMVREMQAREDSARPNLSVHIREIKRAVVSYALAVCSTVDDADPATVESARVALLPIDNARDAARDSARSSLQSDGGDGDGDESGGESAAGEDGAGGGSGDAAE